MAAFSDGYAMRPKNQGGLIRTAVSLLSSGKYIWNPERRAERIVSVTRHATIDFCKAFWSISETDFLRVNSNFQLSGVILLLIISRDYQTFNVQSC